MLQQPEPEDYVIGTGITHAVSDLLEAAFGAADLDWHDYVTEDAELLRPAEVEHLCADPARARTDLGWEPKVGFEELIRMMVVADRELVGS